MHTFQGEVNTVYPTMVRATAFKGDRVPSRVADTVELHPVVAEFTNPARRLVTSYGRAVNVPFALAEVVWILAGRNDVRFLSQFNSRIADYSDDGFTFNAPYGHRLRRAQGYDQLTDVIRLLRRDPRSRQATLTVWHTSDMHHELDLDGAPEEWVPRQTKDRACNLLAHLLIRDGKLDWLQVMRSNDAIWGLPYNLMQWTHLHEYVAQQVGVELGVYRHVADSFHIYEYHEEEAAAIEPFDLYDKLSFEHAPFTFDEYERELDWAIVLASQGMTQELAGLPLSQWAKDFAQIWEAWRCYKEGLDVLAERVLNNARDKVYSAATYRFFWANRWHKQDDGHPTPDKVRRQWPAEVASWIMAS